jgi:hypothetical protein
MSVHKNNLLIKEVVVFNFSYKLCNSIDKSSNKNIIDYNDNQNLAESVESLCRWCL